MDATKRGYKVPPVTDFLPDCAESTSKPIYRWAIVIPVVMVAVLVFTLSKPPVHPWATPTSHHSGEVRPSTSAFTVSLDSFTHRTSAATHALGATASVITPSYVTRAARSKHVTALLRARIAARQAAHRAAVRLPFAIAMTAQDDYVVSLIHQYFPQNAWYDAEAVAYCESRLAVNEIHYDSNGTHARGVFQLNDGGTAQYLMGAIGQNPSDLNLAFNPVLNVRAAAVLYKRDGWSQWSCASVL